MCVCVNVTAQSSISAIFDDTMQWYIGVSAYRSIVLSVCCLFVSCLFATICFISKVLDSAHNWNIHVNHDKIRWFYFPCVVLSKQSSQDLASLLARCPSLSRSSGSAFGFVASSLPTPRYPSHHSRIRLISWACAWVCTHCVRSTYPTDWLSTYPTTTATTAESVCWVPELMRL